MRSMLGSVRREFAGLPAPIRVAYAWVGLVTAMMLASLLMATALSWALGLS